MGANTTYSHFYKPTLGASGAAELTLFDAKIDATDIQIEKSKLLKGLYADIPAAALADRLYYATDKKLLYKDSGTAWEAMLHTQGTDQGLDTGGANAVVVADVKDAVTKKHTQNTDTDLDATFEATFAKKADKLSVFAATTSAELAGVISDETGTDKLVYNTSPTLVTPVLGAASATSINLTGGQITFPAAQAASADANTLDDYEEGTFTPTIAFGGNSVDMTYTTQVGRYTKIGNRVIINVNIVLSAKGTSTGAATLRELPFTSKNVAGAYAPVALYIGTVTFADSPQGIIAENSAFVYLQEITNAGAVTNLTDADFANTSQVCIYATYEIE